ncbi:MAG TPA: A24 family peptidase [archaeon]|nr:A24 family peptidase [archaeon]
MAFTFSLEWIPILAAFGGTAVAAWWDLRTTEVPDEVFYTMFGVGFAYYFYQSFIAGSIWPLVNPLAIAGVLFGIGYIMYKFGQWGGADTFLLTAVGFLLPGVPAGLGFSPQLFFPFPFSYLVNVFLIGTPYMLLYAAFIAFRDKKVRNAFEKDMKASAKSYTFFAVVLFIFFFALSYYLSSQLAMPATNFEIARASLIPVIATLGLFVVFKFSKNVEEIGFKKKIPIGKLKVGDVLEDSVEFVGMSASEVAKIKKSGKKFVVIKEGVRFAPAFPLALLFTLFYGDAIFLILKYFIPI